MLGCCVFKDSKNLSASDSQLKRHIIPLTYHLLKLFHILEMCSVT